jgi:hypothetical protein
MRRVQVRYRTSLDAAHVRCHLGTSWADRNGTHKRRFDAASIDALAIYCPSPRAFAYLLASELNANYVNLRFSKAKNGQVKRTRDASEYRDPLRMFEVRTGDFQAVRCVDRCQAVRCVDRCAAGNAKVGDDMPS